MRSNLIKWPDSSVTAVHIGTFISVAFAAAPASKMKDKFEQWRALVCGTLGPEDPRSSPVVCKKNFRISYSILVVENIILGKEKEAGNGHFKKFGKE